MKQTIKSPPSFFYLIIISLAVFLAGRLFGAYLFEHNWSFTHWMQIPLWYIISWALFSIVSSYLIFKKDDWLSKLFSNKISISLSGLVLMALFIVGGTDSFLYNGGNSHMHQVAQMDTTIFRWFEFGFTLIVSMFEFIFKMFTTDSNLAGFLSLKTLSYLGVLLTLPAAFKLALKLTGDQSKRFLLFIILTFGPHTLIYFGHLGPESMVVAFIYWFVLLAIKINDNNKNKSLLFLWLITIIGLFFHISLLILLPALLVVSLKTFVKNRTTPIAAGVISILLMIYFVYHLAGSNFEIAKEILQINGPDFSTTYHLFSLKHIGDMFQIAFLVFPTFIILKVLFFQNFRQITKNNNLIMLLILSSTANILMLILEPVHSIVLDLPRLSIYLAPLGISVAFYAVNFETRSLKLLAVSAIMVPLAILPIYNNLDLANDYTENYLKKNDIYYIEAGKALQDSYFYNKEINKANYWYIGLPKFSRDYLDLTAAGELGYAGINNEAIKKLNRLKTKYPFWEDSRSLLASIQLGLKRFGQAKVEIDTLLMISPYNKNYLSLLYNYHRDMNNFRAAKPVIEQLVGLYPDDNRLKEDQAICYFRLQDYKTADSLCNALTQSDPNLPYPYFIRGVIAEFKKDDQRAIANYEKFIKLAPDEAETPAIRKKLNDLILKKMEKN